MTYKVGRGALDLEGAYTAPAFRQHGFFGRLIDYAVDIARGMKLSYVYTTANSKWVERVCNQLGFVSAVGGHAGSTCFSYDLTVTASE